MEHEEDFEMKPLKAAIMAMLFLMAYSVSLGGWRLVNGHGARGSGQPAYIRLGEIIDITLPADYYTA